MFSGINSNNLFFFCLKDIEKMLPYFCVCFYSFKEENVLDIFSIDLILFHVKAL